MKREPTVQPRPSGRVAALVLGAVLVLSSGLAAQVDQQPQPDVVRPETVFDGRHLGQLQESALGANAIVEPIPVRPVPGARLIWWNPAFGIPGLFDPGAPPTPPQEAAIVRLGGIQVSPTPTSERAVHYKDVGRAVQLGGFAVITDGMVYHDITAKGTGSNRDPGSPRGGTLDLRSAWEEALLGEAFAPALWPYRTAAIVQRPDGNVISLRVSVAGPHRFNHVEGQPPEVARAVLESMRASTRAAFPGSESLTLRQWTYAMAYLLARNNGICAATGSHNANQIGGNRTLGMVDFEGGAANRRPVNLDLSGAPYWATEQTRGQHAMVRRLGEIVNRVFPDPADHVDAAEMEELWKRGFQQGYDEARGRLLSIPRALAARAPPEVVREFAGHYMERWEFMSAEELVLERTKLGLPPPSPGQDARTLRQRLTVHVQGLEGPGLVDAMGRMGIVHPDGSPGLRLPVLSPSDAADSVAIDRALRETGGPSMVWTESYAVRVQASLDRSGRNLRVIDPSTLAGLQAPEGALVIARLAPAAQLPTRPVEPAEMQQAWFIGPRSSSAAGAPSASGPAMRMVGSVAARHGLASLVFALAYWAKETAADRGDHALVAMGQPAFWESYVTFCAAATAMDRAWGRLLGEKAMGRHPAGLLVGLVAGHAVAHGEVDLAEAAQDAVVWYTVSNVERKTAGWRCRAYRCAIRKGGLKVGVPLVLCVECAVLVGSLTGAEALEEKLFPRPEVTKRYCELECHGGSPHVHVHPVDGPERTEWDGGEFFFGPVAFHYSHNPRTPEDKLLDAAAESLKEFGTAVVETRRSFLDRMQRSEGDFNYRLNRELEKIEGAASAFAESVGEKADAAADHAQAFGRVAGFALDAAGRVAEQKVRELGRRLDRALDFLGDD